jgi:glycosyltransferase involved in cell wall biosynthesis
MKNGVLVSTQDIRPSLMSVLQGLNDEGYLQRIVTCGLDPSSFSGKTLKYVGRLGSARFSTAIGRRVLPEFLSHKIDTILFRDLVRILSNKLNQREWEHRIWLWSELGFDKNVAAKYAGRYQCVYGMEHSSLSTFQKQKRLGGSCILRQVMLHGRVANKTIGREIRKFPEFDTEWSALYERDYERSIKRKVEEYALADLIVANSPSVKESFVREGIAEDKVVSIPTGCPQVAQIPARSGKGSGKLIFLFVGTLSLRKGIVYLLNAWKSLKFKDAELWIAGPKELLKLDLSADGIQYHGAVSSSRLQQLFRSADVFVLPTLLEGLAHSVLEALAFGLPIITTKESGAGDFVREENGFIVPAASSEALTERLEWCLKNRDQLPKMGLASLECAKKWTVADSNRAHLEVVRKFLKVEKD